MQGAEPHAPLQAYPQCMAGTLLRVSDILAGPVFDAQYYVCCNYTSVRKWGVTCRKWEGLRWQRCERLPAALFIASGIGCDKYYDPLALIICDVP
jgi:hypothetical protein